MNSKGLAIALGVLVALGATTAYVYRAPAPDVRTTPTNPWTRLDVTRVDHVTMVRPTGPSDQRTIEFEKSGSAWRMTAPGRGPTEGRSVQELLERLQEMRVVGIAARNASSYETFEVDDGHATRVMVKQGTNVLLDVWVGTSVDSGTAVRVPGHTEVYRIDQSISHMVRREPRDWRDREITHATREQISRVEWVNRNGTFAFTRNGETWTAAAGTTVERLDTARVGSLVDSVANLRATDFAAGGAPTGITADSPRVTLTVSGDAGASTVVVKLGNNSGENEVFVQRDGSEVVCTISRSSGEAMNPTVTAFQMPADAGPPPDTGVAADTGAPAAAPALPSGPGGAQPSIPPEIMEQLRRQMQQRQPQPH